MLYIYIYIYIEVSIEEYIYRVNMAHMVTSGQLCANMPK